MSKQTNNLPTIADLTTDVELAFKNDQFNLLVNQAPPEKWVKTHPHIKGHRYLPIDKVEFLLKRIFKSFKIEVKETKIIMNSVFCMVRVHYTHPVSGEWEWHDGVGSSELQTEKSSGPLRPDMSNVNRGAVPMATGNAKSIAIKDACHHIGELFGANLNRNNAEHFQTDKSIVNKRVNDLLDSCETVEDVKRIKKEIPKEYHDLADSMIDYLESKEAENVED